MKGEFRGKNEFLNDNSIYDFESNLTGNQLAEKIADKKRKCMISGRSLAIDEINEFLIGDENEMEK